MPEAKLCRLSTVRKQQQARKQRTMAAAAGSSDGVVKHLLLARFKEEVTPGRLDGLIRRYAALVDAVPSIKAFHWGTDVSIENMHQGFTQVSTEGVKEYIEHPAHVEYANELLPLVEKVLVIDYKPAAGKA